MLYYGKFQQTDLLAGNFMLEKILQNCALYLPYPVLGLVLSLFFTKLLIFFLPRFGFVDIPRGRHQHEGIVPRGGGIAIWLSFFITMLMFSFFLKGFRVDFYQDFWNFFCKFLPPAGIILAVGLLDDRFELSSWLKLIAQVAIGVLIYFEGAGISLFFGYPLPAFLSIIFTVFWCVIIINAFNLIDGLDGVAAGLAAISSLLLAVWSMLAGNTGSMGIILLVFCGCTLGFLRYNFAPAKIFMGDTGSMFLGLFFAYVSMQYSTKSVAMTSLLIPLAAVGVPIFDVILAVWRRFFRRYIKKEQDSSIMRGDHDHLHHRILRETGTTRKAACIMYSLSLLLSLFAFACFFMGSRIPALFFVLFLIALFVMIRYSSIEVFDTLTSVVQGVRYPHRNFIFTALHPLIDTVLIFSAFWICTAVCKNFLPAPGQPLWLLSHMAPFVVCFCCSGIYRTFWLRAGIVQYYKLLRLLFIAGVSGYILTSIICVYSFNMPRSEMWQIFGFDMVFTLLAGAFIVAERFLLHYYESFGFRQLFIRNQGKHSDLRKVLIYGGGMMCRIYITRQFCGFKLDSNPVKIIGIMDDNKALKGLNVYGFNVLGTVENLEQIFEFKPFDIILVTIDDIAPENLQHLRDFCRKRGLELRSFSCSEKVLS